MTKKELLEELKRCKAFWDAETSHSDADKALLKYINDEDITAAFNSIVRWYS